MPTSIRILLSFVGTMRLLGAGALCLCLSTFTPFPNALAQVFHAGARLGPADAIVVLGGGVFPDGTLSPTSLARAVRGIVLYRKGLAPLIVFSGAGRGEATEADAYRRLARDLDVPSSAILTDASGRTTREESQRLTSLLRHSGARRILLVTNSLHTPRAARLFERQGFEVLAAPVTSVPVSAMAPHDRAILMQEVAEALAALLYYRLSGYL